MSDVIAERPANTDIAKIVYVLYLLALFSGVTAIIGVVMAYMYRDDAPDWLRTHYEMQIRSFWLALLYGIVAGILCLILIGFLLLFLLAIWWIVRCVKGLKYAAQRAPYPDPLGWLF